MRSAARFLFHGVVVDRRPQRAGRGGAVGAADVERVAAARRRRSGGGERDCGGRGEQAGGEGGGAWRAEGGRREADSKATPAPPPWRGEAEAAWQR